MSRSPPCDSKGLYLLLLLILLFDIIIYLSFQYARLQRYAGFRKEGRIWFFFFYLSCTLHFSPWMTQGNTRKELLFLLSWWWVFCEFLFLSEGWPLSNSEAISLLNETVFPQTVFSKVVIWSLLYFWGFWASSQGPHPFFMIINQPWIWQMYINLSLSLFYINHDPPIN